MIDELNQAIETYHDKWHTLVRERLGKDSDAKVVLAAEPNLKWTEEKNGEHCKWLSLWFDSAEAKLRSDTVLDVCAAEMLDLKRELVA